MRGRSRAFGDGFGVVGSHFEGGGTVCCWLFCEMGEAWWRTTLADRVSFYDCMGWGTVLRHCCSQEH